MGYGGKYEREGYRHKEVVGIQRKKISKQESRRKVKDGIYMCGYAEGRKEGRRLARDGCLGWGNEAGRRRRAFGGGGLGKRR